LEKAKFYEKKPNPEFEVDACGSDDEVVEVVATAEEIAAFERLSPKKRKMPSFKSGKKRPTKWMALQDLIAV